MGETGVSIIELWSVMPTKDAGIPCWMTSIEFLIEVMAFYAHVHFVLLCQKDPDPSFCLIVEGMDA